VHLCYREVAYKLKNITYLLPPICDVIELQRIYQISAICKKVLYAHLNSISTIIMIRVCDFQARLRLTTKFGKVLGRHISTTTKNLSTTKSIGKPLHKMCGFLAGIHSHGDKAEFSSFEYAWRAIQEVPLELLDEFENELWITQSKRFIHGNKTISVIDIIDQGKHTSNTVFRHLIHNQRPHLIQTAVEVPYVGAQYNPAILLPSPISQTHLGGLAMAVPFWNAANRNVQKSSPNCLLIGAGGCSLAHTLATNLINRPPLLTAVECCPEIIQAARLWFGAEDKLLSSSSILSGPTFNLVQSTGESYLQSLIAPPHARIDVLIIDAEDGSAPPSSMQTNTFWEQTVFPKLSSNCVVGVNVIGTEEESGRLQEVIRNTFLPKGDYEIISIAPPPEADVSARHKLLFALPKHVVLGEITAEALNFFVDMPMAWEKEIHNAKINK